MKRKISIVMILILLSSCISTNVYAVPESENGEETLILDINTLTERIQQLDNTIITKMVEIEELNAEIEKKELEIEENEIRVEETKEKLAKQKELLEARLRGLYKEGAVNSSVNFFVDLITSESLAEMFTLIKQVSYLAQTDKRIIKENNELEQQLNEEIEITKKLKEELLSAKATVEENLKSIEATKAEVEILLEKAIEEERIRQEEEERRRIEQERLRQEEEERRRLEELNNAANNAGNTNNSGQSGNTQTEVSRPSAPSTVPGDTTINSSLADAIINEAMNYLGVDYVWGGASPDGFDCSGLVQYVYGLYGVKLPRVSQDQQNAGRRVDVSDIQPGDLIFWGTPAWHVAIYIGGGQYIHAPQTGDVVRIAYFDPSRISSVSRVL